MIKYIFPCVIGIILAVSLSFFSHDKSIENLSFHLGFYDESLEENQVEETLNLFNKHFATFFNTGGRLEGLNEFPAANLIKRRIFQEINEWTRKNQLIVYDKDSVEITDITFLNPKTAIALAEEVWFLNIQEKDTRKKFSPVKANSIRVRYLLKKRDEKWGVLEYEVFGSKDDIPALKMKGFDR